MSGTRHSAAPFDVIAVVGSQGALRAFRAILGHLPADFPAAVVFDLHRHQSNGFVERLLAKESELPVRSVTATTPLRRGTLFVTPPDRQVLVTERGLMRGVTHGNGRPGHRFADGLFASAAALLGERLICVVLSGRLEGGARGVRVAKQNGARILAQHPDSADAPAMPNAALATGCVDFVLPPESLGPALVTLCAAPGAAELFRVRLNTGVHI
jgi:two-component system chemotaxis response regulator CheB